MQSVCLGWHWQPYAYSRTADDTDGAPVKPLPADVVDLAPGRGRRHLRRPPTAAAYAPDAAIVNLYAPGARLGLHQDGEEPSDAPVVTISLGDTCTFRLAGVDRRTGPFTDVELRSGDLLVFGGPNRRIFHGVPKVVDRHRARRPRPAAGPAEPDAARDRPGLSTRRAPGPRFHAGPGDGEGARGAARQRIRPGRSLRPTHRGTLRDRARQPCWWLRPWVPTWR